MTNHALSPEIEQQLKDFMNVLHELFHSPFIEGLKKGTSIQVFSNRTKPDAVVLNCPTDVEMKAYTLTFRFLVQDNEAVSIRNVAKSISELPDYIPAKQRFTFVRDQLNAFLDSLDEHEIGGEQLPRRFIMLTLLYGRLAHRNPEKKAIYDKWAKDPYTLASAKTAFMWIVSRVMYSSGYFLHDACREILRAHGVDYGEPLPFPI